MEPLVGFHAVEAALSSGRRTVERVWVLKGRRDNRVARLLSLAKSRGIPVQLVEKDHLERLAAGRPRSAHQGVVASVAGLPYADPEELLEGCGEEAILVIADGVEDPRNLGALVRTAAGAGAAALFIPERRTAGLGDTVARASAGALDMMPVARVGNLASFLKLLKEKGFWTVGLDAEAPRAWDQTSYPPRLALVVGGEGRGLRRLVRESCDETVSIPLRAGLESLNVSVAAGICLYEAVRQRRSSKKMG